MSNRSIHTLLKNWDEECPLTREEAVEVLNLPEEEMDSLMECAYALRTNLRIERTAAVQIMVDTVQSGIFQDSCLLLCQEADGAADLCIFLLHLADTVCKIFNLLI